MTRVIGVEICIAGADAGTVHAAAAAACLGGADAIELCHAMHLDGLTPPVSHIEAARAGFGSGPGLRVMVRPRAGDFTASAAEEDAMTAQIWAAAEADADGVVLGILRASDHRICQPTMRRLLRVACDAGVSVTFHRAFDAAPEADEALETLADLGVARVLTGGRPWDSSATLLYGLPRLQRTVERAAGRLEVIVGGGVTAAVLPALRAALPRGVGPVSVHAYSGAQVAGVTTAESVRGLVKCSQG